jgi:hypothetical protein
MHYTPNEISDTAFCPLTLLENFRNMINLNNVTAVSDSLCPITIRILDSPDPRLSGSGFKIFGYNEDWP